jgi:hypothetical protein
VGNLSQSEQHSVGELTFSMPSEKVGGCQSRLYWKSQSPGGGGDGGGTGVGATTGAAMVKYLIVPAPVASSTVKFFKVVGLLVARSTETMETEPENGVVPSLIT